MARAVRGSCAHTRSSIMMSEAQPRSWACAVRSLAGCSAHRNALRAFWKPRNLLLIPLDNCEHLIKPSAELVHAILGLRPEVRIIATSREALRVPGEQTYTVTPPSLFRIAPRGVEALLRSPAVRLFVERAQLHKPTFALTEQEAPAVAELFVGPAGGHSRSRLRAPPLAAARIRALTVADINVRLKDRALQTPGPV